MPRTTGSSATGGRLVWGQSSRSLSIGRTKRPLGGSGVGSRVGRAGNACGAGFDRLADGVLAHRREVPGVHPDVDLAAVLAPLLMDVPMQQPAAVVVGPVLHELQVILGVEAVGEVVWSQMPLEACRDRRLAGDEALVAEEASAG